MAPWRAAANFDGANYQNNRKQLVTELLFLEPKIRVAPALALVRYLEAHGADFKAIADACGLTTDELADPMRLVPLRQMASFYVMAAKALNDCGLPLKLAEASGVGNSGLMGHLAMAAPTVRAFVDCLAGYAPLLVTNVEAGYAESAGIGRLYWRAPGGPEGFEISLKPVNLFLAASIIHRVRVAAGADWVPRAVTFEHKAPAANQGELALFGRDVTFNRDCSSITFDAVTLAKPLPTANAHLFAIFKHHATLLLRDVNSDRDWTDLVRRSIGDRLKWDAASLDGVAKDLGISPRNLQRRLEQTGSSFEKVLDDMRRATAERLLRETDLPLMQIAFDVGYGSQSTFTRAVRRWLDASPRAYRQRFRGAAGAGAR